MVKDKIICKWVNKDKNIKKKSITYNIRMTTILPDEEEYIYIAYQLTAIWVGFAEYPVKLKRRKKGGLK